ncbi:DUF134 domain-containing protein [Mogibacterium timidum]|mgnify:FL=1|uniref:DUF134 domain-containing protein n=1 Tax=Mogibacterium timidum TaxID=35519 RepID=UPI00248ABB88|nr:DUF134 domain-containing protein [Mogibacterium timidum]
MPGRKTKSRQVETMPEYTQFEPQGITYGEQIVLSVDEFETIRLIDLEHLNQELAANRMNVARTTVTAIYERARTKLADAIVNGKLLLIEGGHVHLQYDVVDYNIGTRIDKGDQIMRIAVTYDNGNIFQHFGKTSQFKLYDVEDGKVITSQVVDTEGAGHGALAGFLTANKVDTLICGGIGGGAQQALRDADIKLFGGVSGNTDEAVEMLLKDELEFNPDVQCNHHGEHHHHEGGCGNHGCHNL